MKLIVGLGNPGRKYENTRHNAGFLFVDQLREFLGWDTFYDVRDWQLVERGSYQLAEAKAGGEIKVAMVKPLTYMNGSGSAVRAAMKRFGIMKVKDSLILAHDDLDISLGKFKIQMSVSPKQHKGVRSVETHIGKKEFLRVRIGVDSREGDRSMPGEEYVLERMNSDENDSLDAAIVASIKNLREVVRF